MQLETSLACVCKKGSDTVIEELQEQIQELTFRLNLKNTALDIISKSTLRNGFNQIIQENAILDQLRKKARETREI